jgi:hypothetical protein
MTRDMKLNYNQYTKKELKKKCQIYEQFYRNPIDYKALRRQLKEEKWKLRVQDQNKNNRNKQKNNQNRRKQNEDNSLENDLEESLMSDDNDNYNDDDNTFDAMN